MDMLHKVYKEVDMFDKSPEAMDEAEGNNIGYKNVIITETCSMQDYTFDKKRDYTAIYMRWCIGYLTRDE